MGSVRLPSSTRYVSSLTCAVVLALTVAACGSSHPTASASTPTSTASTRTVTLWVDLPLAGAAAQESRQMLDAVRLVVAQAEFRVGAIAVRVRASDDADPATGRSDPTRCRAGATRADADRTAIAMIGTYESSCTASALSVLAPGRLALVSPVNSDPALVTGVTSPGGVLIRLAPSDALQGSAAAAEAQALGVHRLFVLDGRTSRAARLRAALVEAAPARAIAIVGSASAPLTADSAGPVVARIESARPDAVWFGSGPGPGVVAVMRALAVTPAPGTPRTKPVVLLGSDALYRNGLVPAAGAAAEGLHLTSEFVPPDALDGAGADFAGAFTRQFGQPGLYTVYAADAARLVLAALARSDGTRAGVLRALYRTRSYKGLIGKLGITANGASTLARIGILRVHDGDFEFERVVDLSPSG
jgi:branched-chain amino acid transport system substrate-binding protein